MVRIVANLNNTLGEGPFRFSYHNALFWIDIIEGKLFRFYPSDQKTGTGDLFALDVGVKGVILGAFNILNLRYITKNRY